MSKIEGMGEHQAIPAEVVEKILKRWPDEAFAATNLANAKSRAEAQIWEKYLATVGLKGTVTHISPIEILRLGPCLQGRPYGSQFD